MIARRYFFVVVMWIVVVVVNLATGGEVAVFGDATIGPVAVADRLLDGLATNGLVVR